VELRCSTDGPSTCVTVSPAELVEGRKEVTPPQKDNIPDVNHQLPVFFFQNQHANTHCLNPKQVLVRRSEDEENVRHSVLKCLVRMSV